MKVYASLPQQWRPLCAVSRQHPHKVRINPKTMQTVPLLLVLVLLTSQLNEGSRRDLCARCNCASDPAYIDCSQRSLATLPTPDEWPSSLAAASVTVDFQYNALRAVTRFPRLDAVAELRLHHNRIATLTTAAFEDLPGLRRLDLSHNALVGEEVRSDVLRGRFSSERYEPLRLVELNLRFNVIASLGPSAFEHLYDLRSLQLGNNPLGEIDANTEKALSGLTTLTVLDLSYTKITKLPTSLLHSLTNLKELYLNGNHFLTVPENLAALGRSLERLNLNDVKVRTLDGNSFLGLTRLRQINASGCSELREIQSGTFSPLVSLDSLHLSYNFNLTYVSPQAFDSLADRWPVKELMLNENSLVSLDERLLPWEDVDILDLQDNPWHCGCEMRWIATRLVPLLRRRNPELLAGIRCSSPPELRGERLMTLNASLMCGSSADLTRWARGRGGHIHPFTLFMVMMTLLVLLLAVAAICRSNWKKSKNVAVMRNVRYTRHLDELENEEYS